MGKRKKSIAWLIITICVCVIFVPIIIFNMILSIKAINNPDKLPTIFGIAPTAVMTGSMEPEFKSKDLIFIKEVDPDTLKEQEDIICFVKDGEFITHRIERIEIVDGEKRFYTKGDANNAEDRGYVLAEQIQGEFIGKVAGLGGVIMFLQDPYGILLVIILLVLLYIAGELFIEWRASNKENSKLTAENEALKAELEKYNQTALTQVVIAEESRTNEVIFNDENVATKNELVLSYKYRRSFISRLIQGGENLQDVYTAIKNYLLKYKGVKSRVSWGAETFSYKRQPIVKLFIKGKSLQVYLALNEEEMTNLQIDEKVEMSKFADLPAKIKVTGVIKLNRAKKAVDVIMARLGLIAGEQLTEKYSYPYESDEQLLEKGLVKLVKSDFVPPERTRQETQETQETQEVQEAQKVQEIQEVAEMTDSEVVDENITATAVELNIQYKYRRSFISRLIQSGEKTQELYTTVKNRLLQYKEVKARTSWHVETFSYKRNPIAKFSIKGKILYAYFALTDEEMANIQVDEKAEGGKFADVPAKFKITGVIKINRTLKAIDTVCQRYNLTLGEEITDDYSYPYETDEQLIEKGLIRLEKSNFVPPVQEIVEDDTEQDQVIADVEDILTGKLTETQKYTRQQYLALPRTKKKKIKTLIRQVDEHLFDEDTPSNERKRQAADLWRDAVVITNK